jgi:hypothetical protein
MDEADSLAGCAVIGRKAGREAAGARLSGIPKTDKGVYTYFVSGLVAFPFCCCTPKPHVHLLWKRERKIGMSEVHEAITAHIQKQHAVIKRFVQLEAERERYIDEAVMLCQKGLPFTVEKINEVTKEMNELAKHGVVPQRKYVTAEMVKEYAERLTKQGGEK